MVENMSYLEYGLEVNKWTQELINNKFSTPKGKADTYY